LVIEGLFGKAYSVITTKELMERKIVSNLKIDAIMLGYPEETRQEMKKSTYNEEMAWLIANPKRNTFITRLVSNLKGNSLVLFQFVENHGKVLVEMLKREIPEREVFFVHGGTATEDRETIRKIMEKNDNAIIVASYGTFSTGISIRRLHNIVFASPSKSRIRILQSIGRQLRLSEHKSLAKLYDLGDDLCWKSKKNHTFLHFMERLKIYESENFEFKTIKIDL
jgi:superfamily II DNA or RNA helicase